MPVRSQRHKQVTQGYDSGGRPLNPAITGISPDTATIAAAGAVNRTIATLSATGGTAPITYTIAAAGGLNMNISGNLLRTNADPVGTAGAKTVGITATDARGQTLTENIGVTVT